MEIPEIEKSKSFGEIVKIDPKNLDSNTEVTQGCSIKGEKLWQLH